MLTSRKPPLSGSAAEMREADTGGLVVLAALIAAVVLLLLAALVVVLALATPVVVFELAAPVVVFELAAAVVVLELAAPVALVALVPVVALVALGAPVVLVSVAALVALSSLAAPVVLSSLAAPAVLSSLAAPAVLTASGAGSASVIGARSASATTAAIRTPSTRDIGPVAGYRTEEQQARSGPASTCILAPRSSEGGVRRMHTVSVAVALARAPRLMHTVRSPKALRTGCSSRRRHARTKYPPSVSSSTRHQHAALLEEYPHVHFDTVSAAIDPLIDDELIDDVLYPVKSGKEATLYCCRGGVRANADLVAVKVYKPQQFRAFRNDSVYQEGRVILDRRSARAAAKRTRHGRQVQASLWTNSEFETLRVLHRAGASVPRPLGQSNGAIAMEWIGNGETPAPQLKDVRLGLDQAQAAFEQLMRDIELWLACNVVHGDLSAYNVLWDAERSRVVTIDFPQASDPRANANAEALLFRDVANVCRHFARSGVAAPADALAADLWQRFTCGQL